MTISNPHNLIGAPHDPHGRYGIRVRLAATDPMQRLLPAQWETFHWYTESTTRDRVLGEMSSRHRYSRLGDVPTPRYEPVER